MAGVMRDTESQAADWNFRKKTLVGDLIVVATAVILATAMLAIAVF